MRTAICYSLRLLGAILLMLTVVSLASPELASAFGFPPPAAGLLSLAVVAPFATDPELIATSMAYRNERLIADEVFPRVPVGKQEFKYYKWDQGESYTIPDTRVGRTSKPNEIEFTATETPSFTSDYALDDPIPLADIENAPAGINPRGRAVEGLTDLILLDREKRVSDVVFALGTYPEANRATLSGSNQFSHADSDPIKTIMTALDVPLMRPNVAVIGRPAYTILAQHPKILQAVHRIGGATAGVAARQAIAELFELEELLVGEAFVNTSRRGQTASFSRVWGKHVALFYRDRLASPTTSTARPTFGFTAQWGDRIAGAERDSNIGMRGGERVRVGESVKEEISCPDLGYFLQNVTA